MLGSVGHAHTLRALSSAADLVRVSALRALVRHLSPLLRILRWTRARLHAPAGPAGGGRLLAGIVASPVRRREPARRNRGGLALGRCGGRLRQEHPPAAG